MNIPPNLGLSTFSPAVPLPDGAVSAAAASRPFAEVLSQSLEQLLAEQRAEWLSVPEFAMVPPPDLPFADPSLLMTPVPDDLGPGDLGPVMGAPDAAPLPLAEGLGAEIVSNMAENGPSSLASDAANPADVAAMADGSGAHSADGAMAMPAEENQASARHSAVSSQADLAPLPPDVPSDPSLPSAEAQGPAPESEQDGPADQASTDAALVQDFGQEILSDQAEIDQSGLSAMGDPMPDGPSSQGPSSPSGSSAPASSSPSNLSHIGTILADHVIQLDQATSDGSVTLTLCPDDLGTMSFEVQQAADGVSVHLTVERPETLDLLRRHADQLMDAFRQAGFAGAAFTFGGGEGGQRDRPPPQTTIQWPENIAATTQRLAVGLLDMRL